MSALDMKRARELADTLATTGPHSYYPTDAECVATSEQLQAACDEVDRLTKLVKEACEIGKSMTGLRESWASDKKRAATRLAAIRAAVGGGE